MNKKIQWFPGHMYKAFNQIKQTLNRVNFFIELLDARIPYSSQNPVFKKIIGNKPNLKILMKSDISDPAINVIWKKYFHQRQESCLIMSIYDRSLISSIPKRCYAIYQKNPSNNLPLTVMVCGIPNVGKSSLINQLAGKSIAQTGNEPTITRMQQKIRLNSKVFLLDTPGVLWPNIKNQHTGLRLATIGAIKETAMLHTDVAIYVANYILDIYPENLKKRYRFHTLPQSGEQLIKDLGFKRGCLTRGGKIDQDRAAKILLNEIKNGKLGRLSLETPTMICAER